MNDAPPSVRPGSRSQTGRPMAVAGRFLLLSLVVLAALRADRAWARAGDVQDATANGSAAGEQRAAEHAADDAAEQLRRHNLVSALFILLGGVCIVGVALIAGTIIWGAKFRRLARQPLAGPTRQDELWYLKKPSVTDDRPPRDGNGGQPIQPSATDGRSAP